MNYIGGKYRLLPQILPLFAPANNFYDVFCGGCNVAINTDADHKVCSDTNGNIIALFRTIQKMKQTFVTRVENIISTFQLSKENVPGYIKVRDIYNGMNKGDEKNIFLFVLVCHSFNHQMRFNGNGLFNMPFGKARSAFNASIKKNLELFADSIQSIEFREQSYTDVLTDVFSQNDTFKQNTLVYADPPYLISTATYNENNGWNTECEKELLSSLDRCTAQGVKFALSNVLVHNGQENEILINWSKKYRVNRLNHTYRNCNYHKKDRDSLTSEVLITNY